MRLIKQPWQKPEESSEGEVGHKKKDIIQNISKKEEGLSGEAETLQSEGTGNQRSQLITAVTVSVQ